MLMQNITEKELDDKIDVEEIIKEYRIPDTENLKSYLEDVWKDLSLRSCDAEKGIDKLTFSKYYSVPGIILDRLFSVLDTTNQGCLIQTDFINGLYCLFSDSFDNLVKFIFNFYDFDKDNLISQEDVRIVLSYIPLKTINRFNNSIMKSFKDEYYTDRLESQDEIFRILEDCFKDSKSINKDQFIKIIEDVNSEIFLFILLLLFELRPFSRKSLKSYNKENESPCVKEVHRLIATPRLNSKFSPAVTLSRSPIIKNISLKFQNRNKDDVGNKKNFLLQFAANKKNNAIKEEDIDKPVALKKKMRISLKNIKNFESLKNINFADRVKGIGNSKIIRITNSSITNIPHMVPLLDKKNSENAHEDLPITEGIRIKRRIVKSISFTHDLIKEIKESTSSEDEPAEEIFHEGFLNNINTIGEISRYWYKLIQKDFYYYKDQTVDDHKGMHNLSGAFVQEMNEKTKIEGKENFSFSLTFPKKTLVYHCDTQEECKCWINKIRVANGYVNLLNSYDILEKLGNGKFGLVKLGVHKKTRNKAAIKIINKIEMNEAEINQVRKEIEILKICQHPNIIRLDNLFENAEYMYIVMEYCAGGDLFTYLDKRNFTVSETMAARLIQKLCNALFYLHYYGVIHRDLKPENMMMTDDTDDAEIKILDFGLSNILNPGENCNEAYGTISYVAPEVLLGKSYSFPVDIWSIGVIAYMLLIGCLPFDHETDENEIARMTIEESANFTVRRWRNTSKASKSLVENLLNKDPNTRYTIKEILDHDWFLEQDSTEITKLRREKKNEQSSKFNLYTNYDTNERNNEQTSKFKLYANFDIDNLS